MSASLNASKLYEQLEIPGIRTEYEQLEMLWTEVDTLKVNVISPLITEKQIGGSTKTKTRRSKTGARSSKPARRKTQSKSSTSKKKKAQVKNEQYYTRFVDIEREMNAYLEYDENVFRGKTVLLPCGDHEESGFVEYFALNFERFGMKKLIATSYAQDSSVGSASMAPAGYELNSSQYEPEKSRKCGKLLLLDRDNNQDGRIDRYDVEWCYLEGSGDFRSDEVRALRDEADIIVTNPPFSLFREFLAWIVEADKKFLTIGNMNAITYKEVFPLIMDNQIWLGVTSPKEFGDGCYGADAPVKKFGNIKWFTNLHHGRRHDPLSLMTEADNIRFSKRELVCGVGYQKYDNYDAIEVPYVIAIPSDYDGAMGVPISFLEKYNPEQFEILDANNYITNSSVNKKPHGLIKDASGSINGKPVYARILIKHRKEN